MEDAASSKNPLNQMRNWEAVIMKENAVMREWEGSWGFMRAAPQKERLFEVGTCKYYSKGLDGTCQAMLRHKRIPILAPQSSELEDKDKAFLQTRICKLREGPERTSSQVYGARKNLELFGVSDFGRGKLSLLVGGKSMTKGFRYI
uniref:Uncharacterized protein n=1 Tax=Hanusia phi TaxID=3032 RepID=A0A7S0HPW6_9CRYP